MRYQTAIPLYELERFDGDELGFRGGRAPRRAERRESRRSRRDGRRRQRQDKRRQRREHRQEASLEPVPVEPAQADWGPLTRLGEQLRVQARTGHRAAVVELQPGMYLVAEVPEASLKPEVGVAPLLAPLLTLSALRALQRQHRRQEPEPVETQVVESRPTRPKRKRLPGPVLPWLKAEEVSGCGCGCERCGGAR